MTTAFTVIAWEPSLAWPHTTNGRIVAKYGGANGLAAPGTPVSTPIAATPGHIASDSMVGDIDEAAIFARALAASEIADLYALAP